MVKGTQALVADRVHRAAPAAVPPVRTPARRVPLPTKRHRAVAAIAPADLEFNFIDKHDKPGE
jgi:hypothetical protein